MAVERRWMCYFLVLLSSLLLIVSANLPHRRFEYKYSFKPPYLAQKDGSIPFWEYGGNSIASAESVRVAPSIKSQKGAIWTKQPINFKWWEIEVLFRVTGRGRIGADGLVIWYTREKGRYDGTVFGSSDQWNGLGIFFDSFDNDNMHNNPYIMAIANDGTKQFDHAKDGTSMSNGGCMRDFRNKPFPTSAKIEYYNNVLTVLFHSGMTNNEQDYELCLRIDNIQLPDAGYFGVSAATGGLADDHDVFHFITTSLIPPGQEKAYQPQVTAEEQERLAREYQEYQQKLDHQKEEYKKDHPEARKDAESEFDEWFETDNQRELRQIFSGQSQIFDVLKELHRKTDELVGRQERLLSLASQQQMPVVPPGSPPGTLPQMQIDTIRRHEVEAVLQNENAILGLSREIRTFIGEIHTRADQILNNQARQPTAQVQNVGYDMSSLVNQVRESLSSIQQTVASAQGYKSPQVPVCQPCLTTSTFLIFSAIFFILFLGVSLYRDRQAQQNKKLY